MRSPAAALAAASLAALSVVVPVSRLDAAPSQVVPVPVSGPDASLAGQLDPIVALAPEDTCLVVSVDGVVAYDHRGADPQAPASAQKLLTSSAVLDAIPADRTFETTVAATAAPVDGVVHGDLALIGGGDPVLVTSRYRTWRGIGDSQPATSLDALADQVAATGVREVQGAIVVDDSRYDVVRTVPTWPSWYLGEQQSGPLGALVVDDGYRLEDDGSGSLTRVRSADPAIDAGRALASLLEERGVAISGGVVRGRAADGAASLATLASPPISALVEHLLRRSDNQVAELLLKELGREVEGRGSTETGARAVVAWASGAGAASPGTFVADGSGLDPTNATTCTDLVVALDAAEPGGPLDAGLPVAGETGTLAARYRDTPAAGVLRAKTGTLDHASALAGFVALPEGGHATFAFLANDAVHEIGPATSEAEALLGVVLATWQPTCPPAAPRIDAPLVATSLALAQATGLGGAVSSPGLVVALDAMSTVSAAPVDRCSHEAGAEIDLGAP